MASLSLALNKENRHPQRHHNHHIAQLQQPEVLVIDDDIDAILPIQKFLADMGINVSLCTDPFKAKKLLRSSHWDLVILDWILDVNKTAPQLLKDADRFVNKIGRLHEIRRDAPCPIISFSILPEKEIFLPSSDHYFHLDHWNKPLTPKQLKKNVLNIFPALFRKTKGGL